MKCWGGGGCPVVCLQQVPIINTAVIPTHTARKDSLGCQQSAHQNMPSAEWELMSCLLCAILSEINRPGCMKGLYVTEGSNGKTQTLWKIMKLVFQATFVLFGYSLPALSGLLSQHKTSIFIFISTFFPLENRIRWRPLQTSITCSYHICL